mmetsp:Transcript_26907/g.59555  ORF Transcript_26907/g.59555 Transcript_26907/m.59555 type:complete len:114 (+) Transcript_26907:129-470(+)|eukprot:CAMPEP_0204414538 /NCGR_PEP_ID=MMETSP0470-20130426/20803_1 /ASSEMBLY_ACC=CAM_ASM_000385 /TAXON_ID=2969 /ORGANISM="Oxyrrhis marina" /LENGTH=113 /DNA_ID=CAMNT_0051410799 /DNA_START=120 /DNA_END=461 /DNA_ORIENTATION=+
MQTGFTLLLILLLSGVEGVRHVHTALRGVDVQDRNQGVLAILNLWHQSALPSYHEWIRNVPEPSSQRGEPQELWGMPKVVWVVLADVLAMTFFLACIPVILSVAKNANRGKVY